MYKHLFSTVLIMRTWNTGWFDTVQFRGKHASGVDKLITRYCETYQLQTFRVFDIRNPTHTETNVPVLSNFVTGFVKTGRYSK